MDDAASLAHSELSWNARIHDEGFVPIEKRSGSDRHGAMPSWRNWRLSSANHFTGSRSTLFTLCVSRLRKSCMKMRFGSIYLGQRYGCFMLWISCRIVEGSGDLLLRMEYRGVWERDTLERCGMERGGFVWSDGSFERRGLGRLG